LALGLPSQSRDERFHYLASGVHFRPLGTCYSGTAGPERSRSALGGGFVVRRQHTSAAPQCDGYDRGARHAAPDGYLGFMRSWQRDEQCNFADYRQCRSFHESIRIGDSVACTQRISPLPFLFAKDSSRSMRTGR